MINHFFDRYFMVLRDGTVSMHQKGVFRTNCVDCLDRTNVVQGLIAKGVLQQQLVVSQGNIRKNILYTT